MRILSEKARKRAVKLVFTIYFLLIFEGAIRKWILPGAQEFIFFIRDPFLIFLYLLCFVNGLRLKDGLFFAYQLLAVATLILAFLQFLVTDANILVLIYGLRNYLLYIPLSFVIAGVFRKDDVIRFVRISAWLCILLFPLVLAQYLSSPDAFINKQVGDGFVFRVNEDTVRTTGTFSFSTGQSLLAAAFFAISLAGLASNILKKELSLFVRTSFFTAATGMVLMTGSRGAYLHAFFILASLVAIAFFRGQGSLRLRIVQLLSAVSALLLVTVIVFAYFPGMIQAMSERNENAVAEEGSPIARSFRQFTDVFENIPNTKMLGEGIGIGTTGGSYLQTGSEQLSIAEIEWTRIVLETGPIIGFLYIAFRIAILFKATKTILFSKTRRVDPTSASLWSFTALVLLIGQVTHQGTVNGFCWLFVGLTLASIKVMQQSIGPNARLRERSDVLLRVDPTP